jgi:hypothetical protein
MVRAVKTALGLALAEHQGQWEIQIGASTGETNQAGEIVDLGQGLCFRRQPDKGCREYRRTCKASASPGLAHDSRRILGNNVPLSI